MISADTRRLLKQLQKQGATVTQGKHFKVTGPGHPLVTISVSGSDGRRGMKNVLADLRRAGWEV